MAGFLIVYLLTEYREDLSPRVQSLFLSGREPFRSLFGKSVPKSLRIENLDADLPGREKSEDGL